MTHTTFCNVSRLTCVFLIASVLTSGLVTAQSRNTIPHARVLRAPYAPASLRQGADGLKTIENGQIKVGVNTNFGGAITYLAFLDTRGGNVTTTNMVNNPDLGRQIQIGLYSGPNNYSDRAGYTNLGWDPIQAGDAYGYPSEVVTIEKQQNLLYVKTIPKQFGIPNEPGEATIEHWIRLDGNVVKVHAKVVMFRSDRTQYEARQQEFPCVYLNGDYHNMWFYKDRVPYTNGSLALERIQPPSTMLFGDVLPTEPWMASTNDRGYGVGLYVPDNYEWKRGYFGSDLSGDEHSTVASYIAATNRVILDYNMTYEWDYELILGHLSDIRSYVYAKPRLSAGPNYRFDTSRKGWYYQKATDTGWPIQGKLHVAFDDPTTGGQITSPYVFWKGRTTPKIYLRAAFRTRNNKIRFKWRRSEDQTMYGNGNRYMDFPIMNDGQFHTYEINLSGNDNWLEQNIGQVALALVPDGPSTNEWAEIEWIATSPDGPTNQVVNPPVIDEPVVVVPPVTEPQPVTPCEPGCALVGVRKVQYVRSNRRR